MSVNPAGTHRSAVESPGYLLDELSVTDLGAVELYQPSSPIPLFALNRYTLYCGTIILWSDWMAQLGGHVPQIDVKLCEPAGGAGAVTLDGTVEDRLTQVRLPAARIRASFVPAGEEGPLELPETEVRSDSTGRCRLCDLPSGTAVTLAPSYGPHPGEVAKLRAEPGTAARLVVPVTMPGSIAGRVVNGNTGRGFSAVPVVLVGTDVQVVTDGAPLYNGRPAVRRVPSAGRLRRLQVADAASRRLGGRAGPGPPRPRAEDRSGRDLRRCDN